jgi:hypothetical protein
MAPSFRQSARFADQMSVFRSQRLLHLGKAAREWKIHRRLAVSGRDHCRPEAPTRLVPPADLRKEERTLCPGTQPLSAACSIATTIGLQSGDSSSPEAIYSPAAFVVSRLDNRSWRASLRLTIARVYKNVPLKRASVELGHFPRSSCQLPHFCGAGVPGNRSRHSSHPPRCIRRTAS